ncbi:DUF4176 domain-containing protein [Staphylococcus epidermidis]|uniref:DUF4176 domain-containing protein n=1 Tax=Staphylococcus epidermidis TaxID=1282 RepID=UPI0011A98485|nr:DUF4176 domain-containing protein [Staphylococcus epidermidis]
MIYLKEPSQNLIIINPPPILHIHNQKYIFHYSPSNYPLTLLEHQIYYFNQHNIHKLLFQPYSHQHHITFQQLFKHIMPNFHQHIKPPTLQQKHTYRFI